MQRTRRLWWTIGIFSLLLALLAVVGCSGGEEGDPEVLRWGLIPADDAAEMIRQYEPVVEYLEGKLDMEM